MAQQPGTGITASWDDVIKDEAKSAVSPALTQIQTPVQRGSAGDFANHFFMEWRTEYRHSDVSFTGLATPTGIINAPFNGTFTPGGFPWDRAFQPSANRIFSFMNFGTRGWLSDRLNTRFGIRHRQELTNVFIESPNTNILGRYNGGKLFEIVEASAEFNSRPTDGAWAGSSLELGRLNIYGAEMASFDGASYRLARGNVSLNLFGGRRFTYFSDPLQRGIGGGSINVKVGGKTSVGYETLYYLRGTHRVNFRRMLTRGLTMTSYFRAYGGAPTDFNVQLLYGSRSGRSSFRGSFFQKLSDKDYSYDIFVNVTDRDPRNRLTRLYLGQLQPYSQFLADGRQSFAPWFTTYGSIAIQRLNDSRGDQNAFQTSFEDYRAGAQIVPLRKFVADLDYHRRDSDRLPSIPRRIFDQITTSGETKVDDVSGQLRRSFGEGVLTLSGGVYYRRISMQTRFLGIEGAHQSGWLAGGVWKINGHNRLLVDYALDNDFFVFRPSVSNARVLRLGWTWKY